MKWALSIEDAIDKYDLADHVAEIDEVGVTVVPPEKTGMTTAMKDRAMQRLLNTVRERTGADFDVVTGPLQPLDESRAKSKGYFFMTRMLEEDRIFVDLQTNPVLNTLHRYVLGEDFRLSSSSGMIKWLHPQGGSSRTHGMHVDSPFARPAGFGYVAIVNWLLTDYTLDAGPFCYVPGSHRWGEPPTDEKVTPDVLSQVKGVESPANSFIVFNASLWHGSLRRTKPGMRLSANTQRCLPQIIPNGDFRNVADRLIESSDDPEVMRMLCWKTDARGLASGGLAYDQRRGIPRAMATADPTVA